MYLFDRHGTLELARHVLKQWYLDGMPDDFDFLDPSNPESGTFYDFWTGFSVLWEEKEAEALSLPLPELSYITYFYK